MPAASILGDAQGLSRGSLLVSRGGLSTERPNLISPLGRLQFVLNQKRKTVD